jgi:DNA (cytosine-5)-methyltransferase 1
MNHLSLFSGIGGLDLAAEWAGFRTVAFVERDPYCQRVLAKHWPGVPIIGDVRQVVADASSERDESGAGLSKGRHEPASVGSGSPITLVSGGFPCQPHSVAGKRQASADDRDLWPEVARVLRAVRPRWFVGENVRGLLHSESGRFFGAILGDLADLGYRVGWGVWGAADVGALHQRDRVFIVAYAGREEASGGLAECRAAMADAHGERGCSRPAGREDAAHAWESSRGARERIWLAEPPVGRVAHGVPGRAHRLRALGNAVVPQQAYPLFKAIAEIEGMKHADECSTFGCQMPFMTCESMGEPCRRNS